MQCNDLRLTSLIYISQKSKLKLLHNSCNSNPFQLPHAQFIPSTGTDSLWSEENEEDSQYFTPTNFLQLSQSCALLHPLISHCSPPPSNFLSAELPYLGTAQHPCPGSVLIPAGSGYHIPAPIVSLRHKHKPYNALNNTTREWLGIFNWNKLGLSNHSPGREFPKKQGMNIWAYLGMFREAAHVVWQPHWPVKGPLGELTYWECLCNNQHLNFPSKKHFYKAD